MNALPSAPLDLDGLEKIARAATQSDWSTYYNGNAVYGLAARGAPRISQGSLPCDATHIAAFDPPTALALIAAARESASLRAELEEARAERDARAKEADDFAEQIVAHRQSAEYFRQQDVLERENAATARERTLIGLVETAREALKPFVRAIATHDPAGNGDRSARALYCETKHIERAREALTKLNEVTI